MWLIVLSYSHDVVGKNLDVIEQMGGSGTGMVKISL